MENQVTSIGQSKRLLELGVPAEKASMVWSKCSDVWNLVVDPHYMANVEYMKSGLTVPAFTVADLLELLPFEIDADCGLCYLQIKKLFSCRNYTEWGVYYKNDGGDIPFESITSYGIIEALFDMVGKIICYGGCCELNL